MSGSNVTIASFHDDIVQWRSQGLSLSKIAEKLQAQGLEIDRHGVNRYCNKERIPLGTETHPVSATQVSTSPPPSPKGPNIQASEGFTFFLTVPPSAPTPAAPAAERPIDHAPSDKPNHTDKPAAIPLIPQTTMSLAAAQPTNVLPPPSTFFDLDPYRAKVLFLAGNGCNALETWGVLSKLNVQTTPERVQSYMDSLYYQLNPPGTVTPHLYQIYDHDFEWADHVPVLAFGEGNQADVWELADFFQGTLILGSSGSGKTSGSGRTLAMTFLKLGFGGLILTTKPEEYREWADLAVVAQRGSDMIVVCPDGMLRVDFLAYETQRPGENGKLVENLVHFFKNIVSVLSQKRGHITNANFWQSTGDQLLRNLLNCAASSGLPITIDALSSFLVNAPQNLAAADESQWRQLPVFGEYLAQAEKNANTPEKQANYQRLREYWLHYYPTLAHETRSCVAIGFAAMVDALRAPGIQSLIAEQTTITPEAILNGRVILINLPINVYHEAGLLVQAIWKYLFERAVLCRPDKSRGQSCRPVFLWEDECQNFLIDFDADFNRVARDCRVARVMISQNINNFYDAFGGGDSARVKVDSILGTLNTRIFHANGDLATNKWASETIGTYEKKFTETSTTPAQYEGFNPIKSMFYKLLNKPKVTTTTHTVRESAVQPHQFTELIPGGQKSGFMTEAIITQVGRTHADGRPFARVHFNQIILSAAVHTQETLGVTWQAIRDA